MICCKNWGVKCIPRLKGGRLNCVQLLRTLSMSMSICIAPHLLHILKTCSWRFAERKRSQDSEKRWFSNRRLKPSTLSIFFRILSGRLFQFWGSVFGGSCSRSVFLSKPEMQIHHCKEHRKECAGWYGVINSHRYKLYLLVLHFVGKCSVFDVLVSCTCLLCFVFAVVLVCCFSCSFLWQTEVWLACKMWVCVMIGVVQSAPGGQPAIHHGGKINVGSFSLAQYQSYI